MNMKKNTLKFFVSTLHLLAIIGILVGVHQFNQSYSRPAISVQKEDSALNFNSQLVDFFSLGYRRMITSIFWVSTILESDNEHYKKKDENSWMFLRFKTISILDPKFYENYSFGGQYLSIIKDDDLGAKYIYDKGLSLFPNDYDLIFNAGFHYYFELENQVAGMELYKKIINHPKTPKHIVSFIARNLASDQSPENSLLLIESLYEKNKNVPYFRERYDSIIYALRAEIDLKCLNSGKTDCYRNDAHGEPYVLKNGVYGAKKPWEPFRKLKRAQ